MDKSQCNREDREPREISEMCINLSIDNTFSAHELIYASMFFFRAGSAIMSKDEYDSLAKVMTLVISEVKAQKSKEVTSGYETQIH